jgi:signal transduction histidine kinase
VSLAVENARLFRLELHGGAIEAHSAGEGAGATFIVRLPCPAPHAGP